MAPRFAFPARQQGAIGLMAAITLGMALVFMLLVIDSGRLYMEQRNLQRVADAAALEASNLNAVCTGNGVNALTQATSSAARNGFTVGNGSTLTAACGTLATVNNLRTFSVNSTATQAIQVVAKETVTTSVASGVWQLVSSGTFKLDTTLQATATAGYVGEPLAQLSIRSTLASVNTSQSAALNGLFSGLLGGTVSISAVGWDGLVKTDVNLLNYMNQLATNLNLTVGDYSAVLTAKTTVGELISAAAQVLPASGSTVLLTSSLANLSAAATLQTPVTLGNLLQLQTATDATALNADLQLFTLLQAIAQLSSSTSGVSVSVPVNVLGLASITTTLKIIEPPQFSVVANPNTNPGKLYVRTAQARLLTSVSIPLVDATLALLKPTLALAVTTLNSAGKILTGCALTGNCVTAQLSIIPSTQIDVGLEIGSGYARFTGYSCPPSAKTLSATGSSSPLTVSIGKIDASAFLSSNEDYTVSPIVLVDIATTTCKAGVCANPVDFGAGGLQISVKQMTPLSKDTPYSNVFANPPNVGAPSSTTYSYPAPASVVSGLTSALGSVHVEYVAASTGGLLTTLLGTVVSLLTNAVSGLTSSVGAVLSPLVDPLINNVLNLLGIDVNQITVGANLTCQSGRAQLVL